MLASLVAAAALPTGYLVDPPRTSASLRLCITAFGPSNESFGKLRNASTRPLSAPLDCA
jgi:hypothetical protein